MDEFKIGGKITINESEGYIIVDIVNYKGKDYYFCSTDQKPIIPKVFERIDLEGETYINEVTNVKIIRHVVSKVLEE